MRKQTLLILGGVSGLLIIGAILTFFVLNNDKTDVSIIPQPSTPEGSIALDLNQPGGTIPLGQVNNQSQNSNPGLQVLGSESTSSSSSLPGPEDFDQYEQLAQDDSTSFIDVVEGNGREASVGDTLAVVYSGWLTDGTLFDQSRRNEQGQIEAFTFELGARQVIQGWEQGLLGMREGGRRRLIIPAALGYGASGQGSIPPNSMLIFDVELAQVAEPFNPDAGL